MPWDFLKVGKPNLYGDCRQVFEHRLSKYLLPQRSVADDDTRIYLRLPNSNLKLCTNESLQLFYLWSVLLCEQLQLSVLSIRFRSLDEGIHSMLVGNKTSYFSK